MRIVDIAVSFSIAILSLHILILQGPAQLIAQEKSIKSKNELIDSVIEYINTHPLIWILNSNRSELCSSLNLSNPNIIMDIMIDTVSCVIEPNRYADAYTIELILFGHKVKIEAWKV